MEFVVKVAKVSEEYVPATWAVLVEYLCSLKQEIGEWAPDSSFGVDGPLRRLCPASGQRPTPDSFPADLRECMQVIDGWRRIQYGLGILPRAWIQTVSEVAEEDPVVRGHAATGFPFGTASDWLLVATSDEGPDRVYICRQPDQQTGVVVWVDEQGSDEFATFRDWFVTVIENHHAALDLLRRQPH